MNQTSDFMYVPMYGCISILSLDRQFTPELPFFFNTHNFAYRRVRKYHERFNCA